MTSYYGIESKLGDIARSLSEISRELRKLNDREDKKTKRSGHSTCPCQNVIG